MPTYEINNITVISNQVDGLDGLRMIFGQNEDGSSSLYCLGDFDNNTSHNDYLNNKILSDIQNNSLDVQESVNSYFNQGNGNGAVGFDFK